MNPRPTIDEVLRSRSDHSPYLVHLTRDAVMDGRIVPAGDILRHILMERRLRARRPHGVVHRRLRAHEQLARKSACLCFSEIPISSVRYICQPIEGRAIKLMPYGVVFHKDFLRKAGGNPVWYLNTYGSSEFHSAFLNSIPKTDLELLSSPVLKLLPFVDICGPAKVGRHDFSWEREWRVVGDLTFEYKDIVLGICDTPQEVESFEAATGNVVPFIWKDASADDVIARMRQMASYRFDIDENAQKVLDEYHEDLASDAQIQAWKDERGE